MTNEQTNQQLRPQRREDYKVEKLVAQIEMRQGLEAKMREAQPSKQ